MKKTPARRRGPKPHPAVGGNHPSKATCLSSVVKGWQKGPFSPRGLRRLTRGPVVRTAVSASRRPLQNPLS